ETQAALQSSLFFRFFLSPSTGKRSTTEKNKGNETLEIQPPLSFVFSGNRARRKKRTTIHSDSFSLAVLNRDDDDDDDEAGFKGQFWLHVKFFVQLSIRDF
ncbi:unnamed protein product, partial [Linum tenue]